MFAQICFFLSGQDSDSGVEDRKARPKSAKIRPKTGSNLSRNNGNSNNNNNHNNNNNNNDNSYNDDGNNNNYNDNNSNDKYNSNNNDDNHHNNHYHDNNRNSNDDNDYNNNNNNKSNKSNKNSPTRQPSLPVIGKKSVTVIDNNDTVFMLKKRVGDMEMIANNLIHSILEIKALINDLSGDDKS
jgi:DNA mismatch repair ATPase MutL